MEQSNNTSFYPQPLPELSYLANKNVLDKIPLGEYSLQELLKMLNRRGNSGVSWDPSSQKIFELAENIWQNVQAKL